MMEILEKAPIFPVTGGLPLKEAVLRNPRLKAFLIKQDPPKIDLENRAALILYNTTIAKEVLGLDLQLEGFSGLIPTPMLRYNFLKRLNPQNCNLLEIGTGYTAIVSLIAAKCFQATCIATEVNATSLESAQRHVIRNNLQEKITLLPAKEGKLIDEVVPETQRFDLIISNPPYYEEILSPKVIWGGDPNEFLNQRDGQPNFCVQFFREAPRFLKPSGSVAALISGKQEKIIQAVLTVIEEFHMEKEIFGLKAGNRIRWAIRAYLKTSAKI